MKLNLGCGDRHFEGFENVDSHAPADRIVDLECLPWPWEDDSVEHVLALHVLEHIGADAATFLGIVKELYRVCKHGTRIEIAVPSPWHDDFVNDPTHVRPITPEGLALFSKKMCDEFKEKGAANSRLAHVLGVDLQPEHIEYVLDERFKDLPRGATLEKAMTTQRNIVKEIKMGFVVVKQYEHEDPMKRLDIALKDGEVVAR
jgi:SAM-dependent methyltransferase